MKRHSSSRSGARPRSDGDLEETRPPAAGGGAPHVLAVLIPALLSGEAEPEAGRPLPADTSSEGGSQVTDLRLCVSTGHVRSTDDLARVIGARISDGRHLRTDTMPPRPGMSPGRSLSQLPVGASRPTPRRGGSPPLTRRGYNRQESQESTEKRRGGVGKPGWATRCLAEATALFPERLPHSSTSERGDSSRG